MNIEEELLERAGNQMAQDIDREVLWGMLEGIGWCRVMIPTLGSREQAIDIAIWLKEHCKDAFESNGRDVIFESQKDANWFVLRWGAV
jgi:hypothetical protein